MISEFENFVSGWVKAEALLFCCQQKQQENEQALKLLSNRLETIDALSSEDDQWLNLVEGLLAGNVFDWGAKEVATLMEGNSLGFKEALDKLQRTTISFSTRWKLSLIQLFLFTQGPWSVSALCYQSYLWIYIAPLAKKQVRGNRSGSDQLVVFDGCWEFSALLWVLIVLCCRY